MRRSVVLSGTAVCLALSACAAPAAVGSSSSSGSSGPVVAICGASEDWCKAMTSAYQKASGVATSYVRVSSGTAVARLMAARSSPEFGVWIGGPADGYVAAAGQGLLAPYVSPNAAQIPARYKDPRGMWTGVYTSAIGFCSNTAALKKLGIPAPTSWHDLLNPALRGKVELANPAASGTAYTTLWTQVALAGGNQDAALAYFKQLNRQIPQYPQVGQAPGEAAGRGEVAVGIVFTNDCTLYARQGEPLTTTLPAEGTGYQVGAAALVAGAKHAGAAKKFLDWILTPAAQQVPATVQSFEAPVNPKATISKYSIDPATEKLVSYDVSAAGKAKAVLTKRFTTEVINGG
jgi:iron(III) transport system substrate-binding protein